jgi:anti-sigma regulatory factor (Ser/Thr protein kinase)
MSKPRKQSQEIRDSILKNIEEHPQDIASFTAGKFSISRQAVHRHIRQLINDGLITVQGATRDRKYELKPLVDFQQVLPLNADLREDKVWREHLRPRLEGVPPNVLSICQYGFTEMVNNAIDHSQGTLLSISLKHTPAIIELGITDNGIGIFNKIQKALNLDDPLHAILELSKGKLTTDPGHHTGEGIFFTSRMFDDFRILSGNLFFNYVETAGDWLLEDQKELLRGTLITLKISPHSTRTTQQVFNRYASGEDYGFTKTHVPVSLARYGDENLISRSQAKRLLTRFERFKEIILDFKGVDTIGQAFADEIFRVFQNQNPQIHLTPINTHDQIEKMISRVKSATQ